MRAINNVGTIGAISNPQTVKIDKTAPTGVTVTKGTVTTKSIQVTANGTDGESGITKYEFSKNNGTSWEGAGTNKTYTFTNLTTGSYTIKVRVTNGSGLQTTSTALTVSTSEITLPTYSIDTTGWAKRKVVTVTYPARQTDFVYQYSTNGGSSWTTVSSGTTAKVTFNANGTIIARVTDGVNTVTASTYTVDKIDTGTPTAPTITGGSTSWTNTKRTISVSTASTSASGIKNYQYYISTSNTTQTGGTWTDLASGKTSVDITTNGTRYIYFRAVNNVGTTGAISSPQTTMVDTGTPTAPTITGGSTTWINGKRTISVSTASTSTSGIKNYQYYVSTSNTGQSGGSWTSLASGKTSVDITTNGTRYIYFRAVNNAGTTGAISSPQTTKIDTSTPTAPTLTGGSTAWINGNRTISVSTASTSPSGIKNYQYYISTSGTSQTGGTWTDLTSGTTSVAISTNGTRYIYFRAVNNVGKVGAISSPQTTKIDKTAATGVSVGKGTVTTKSIQVTANGTDSESGITKYEFSKDNGSTWVSNGASNTYTFTNLTTGTYNMKVRVTNGSGITTTSSVLAIPTTEIPAPTYKVNTTGWAPFKTVTITYPTRQTDFVYEYSTNGGSSWTTVSSGTTAQVKFTSNGTIIARVRDGVNTKTASTYTVSKVDATDPINVSAIIDEITMNSITVTANGTDGESGIRKYEFSKNGGVSWVSSSTNNTYTFDNLTPDTYNIMVRVTNGAGSQVESTTVPVKVTIYLSEFLRYNKVDTNVNGSENGLYTIDQNGDVSSNNFSAREYRYIGPSPDNYVIFNNELWRIVGIFDEKIKIVKETTAFQDILYNPSNFMPGETSYERLNTEYYNTLSNVSNVADQTFYTSRQDTTKYQRKEAYDIERSQNMTYDGHVGLLLPSDYGYAASTSCQVIISDYDQCADKNWMVNGDNFALLSLGSGGSYHSTAPMINASGGTEYYYSGEHTVNFRPTLYLKSDTVFTGGNGTKTQPYQLKEKETAATYLVNNKVETTINGNENGLYPVNQSGNYTSDTTDVREYRYIGSNPNNYVKFNDELWRIIGVFDGKLKMVREDVIGDYLIQDIRNFVPDQAFYKYLNTDYYGTFTQSEYINYHTYQLYKDYYSDTAPNLYNREHNDSSTETSDVNAYVYLMTPSDYGYAASTSCTNTTLNSTYDCADKNWMVSGESFAMLGFSGGTRHITGPLVNETGGVDSYNETMTVNIRPVIYLNPSTMFASGEGSKDNPYILE